MIIDVRSSRYPHQRTPSLGKEWASEAAEVVDLSLFSSALTLSRINATLWKARNYELFRKIHRVVIGRAEVGAMIDLTGEGLGIYDLW